MLLTDLARRVDQLQEQQSATAASVAALSRRSSRISTVTSYVAAGQQYLQSAANQSYKPLPTALRQHEPPSQEVFQELSHKLAAVGGLQADWVAQLSKLELATRKQAFVENGRQKKRGPQRGRVSYSEGNIGPVRIRKADREHTVQLSAGYLFRVLADAQLTEQLWRDTSGVGVETPAERPDFCSFQTLPTIWTTAVGRCTT